MAIPAQGVACKGCTTRPLRRRATRRREGCPPTSATRSLKSLAEAAPPFGGLVGVEGVEAGIRGRGPCGWVVVAAGQGNRTHNLDIEDGTVLQLHRQCTVVGPRRR